MGAGGSRKAQAPLIGLIEERGAELAVNAALDKWPRAEDAWEAVTWVICRDPDIGIPLTESGLTRSFTLQGARSIGLPTVTVVYEKNIALIVHDALFEEPPYGQVGRA